LGGDSTTKRLGPSTDTTINRGGEPGKEKKTETRSGRNLQGTRRKVGKEVAAKTQRDRKFCTLAGNIKSREKKIKSPGKNPW